MGAERRVVCAQCVRWPNGLVRGGRDRWGQRQSASITDCKEAGVCGPEWHWPAVQLPSHQALHPPSLLHRYSSNFHAALCVYFAYRMLYQSSFFWEVGEAATGGWRTGNPHLRSSLRF